MNEWKKLSEEETYRGYRDFRIIVRKQFERPDGEIKTFDVKVEKNVACILAITKDKKVVLERIFRPGPERYLIEMPGGDVEVAEDKLAAASRELSEETGYAPAKVHFLGTTISCPYSTRQKANFLAVDCTPIPGAVLDFEEQPEVLLMDLEEFRKRLFAGEFPESETGFLGLACYDALEAAKALR